MATTTVAFFRGAATTMLTTTLYTVPAVTTAIVSSILVTNTAAAAGTFNLTLDGVSIATAVSIAANSFIVIDTKQVLATAKIIAGGASAVTINFHISGVTIV
jgi:hypothetical protein